MTAAAWITALAGLFTATVNGIAWVRHGRRDEARFADHGGVSDVALRNAIARRTWKHVA